MKGAVKGNSHRNRPDCGNWDNSNWLSVNKALTTRSALGRCTNRKLQCIGGQSNPAIESSADEWSQPPFSITKQIRKQFKIKNLISIFIFRILITVRPLLAISLNNPTHCKLAELSNPLSGKFSC